MVSPSGGLTPFGAKKNGNPALSEILTPNLGTIFSLIYNEEDSPEWQLVKEIMFAAASAPDDSSSKYKS